MTGECILRTFLLNHPEIERVRLIYTWEFFGCEVIDDYFAMIVHGRRYDPEYCYVGTRQGAIEFLKSYGDTWSMYDEMDLWRAYNSKTKAIHLKWDGDDYEGRPSLDPVPREVESMLSVLIDIEDVEARTGRDFYNLDDRLLWHLYQEGLR